MRKLLIAVLLLVMISGCEFYSKVRQSHGPIDEIGFNETASRSFEAVKSSRLACPLSSIELHLLKDEYAVSCEKDACVYIKKDEKTVFLMIQTGLSVVENDRFAVYWEGVYDHESIIKFNVKDLILNFEVTFTDEKNLNDENVYLYVRTLNNEQIIDTVFKVTFTETNELFTAKIENNDSLE